MANALQVHDEIKLVLDRFLHQQQLADLGFPEHDICNPKSRVVCDAEGDGRKPQKSLGQDSVKLTLTVQMGFAPCL
jgi:hypothetical protein